MYRGKATTIPRHPSKELRKGTVKSILTALGLRMEKS
jgi:predicted RNA binding protein YcfA (HicA-like mRNA interferase family)